MCPPIRTFREGGRRSGSCTWVASLISIELLIPKPGVDHHDRYSKNEEMWELLKIDLETPDPDVCKGTRVVLDTGKLNTPGFADFGELLPAHSSTQVQCTATFRTWLRQRSINVGSLASIPTRLTPLNPTAGYEAWISR